MAEWFETRFDHDRTRFALLGRHRDVRCEDCHRDRKYKDTATECVACHRKDDKHEGQLGTRCDSCHDEQRWSGVRFDHAKARFPLLGRHLPLRCDACHTTARYRDAESLVVGTKWTF